MKLNIPKQKSIEERITTSIGNFVPGPTQQCVWHIRVQRWLGSRRKKRVSYRIIANSKTNALNELKRKLNYKPTMYRFHSNLVVTRCMQGKQV